MTRKYFFALFLFVFLLTACGMSANEQTAPSGGESRGVFDEAPEEASAEPPSAFPGNGDDTLTSTGNNLNPAQQPETQERLIIRTGNLDIVVEDTEASLAEIGRLAERLGGWIVTSEVRQYNAEAKSGSITLRVPAEEYDQLVSQIKEMALDVPWESTNSQDVTEEYVDLSARLGNLEATADRVRAFLDDSETVEEALAVNQELSRLEGEIEVIKGRMQYLSQSAAFSTLTVNLTPDILSQPIEVAGWRPEGTAKEAIETLVRTLQTLADAGIVIGLYFVPLALLFGIPAYILFRVGRNWYRRRNQNAAVEAAE